MNRFWHGTSLPARPYLLQLHLDLSGCFGLPVSFWLGLGLPLHPRGVLIARVKLRSLRLNPSRRLVRPCLQLIPSRRTAAVVISLRPDTLRLFRRDVPGSG